MPASVPTRIAPFAVYAVLGTAVAKSNAVNVIISNTSPADNAGDNAVMLVPLVAV